MDGSSKTRDLFLSGISLTYTFAFLSLFPQIPGLYGRNGIIPVSTTIQQHIKTTRTQSAEVLFSQNPTLMYFTPFEPENSMELFCLIGGFLGVLSSIFKFWRTSYVYFSMYLLYLSVFKVGSSFLWFQWDTLLLEVGFLCIFLAPMLPSGSSDDNRKHHKNIPWFLVKWLMFRLMFASGVVKLTSGCHTWWNLTALNYHYESQCLPTPLAWWAHQLPTVIQQLSVVGTYIIEIGLPFLFFCPIRSWRLLAGYAQVFLMLMIILTGNYNFFNFLTILLSLPMFDDQHFEYLRSKFVSRSSHSKRANSYSKKYQGSATVYGDEERSLLERFKKALNICGLILSAHMLKRLFYFNHLMLNFTMDDLNTFLDYCIPTMVWISVLSFVLVVIKSFYRNATDPSSTRTQKVINLSKGIFHVPFCVFLFSISMIPFFSLLPGNHKLAVITKDIFPLANQWYGATEPYQITHSYGLFRRMTGVGGRPEVIVEGSNDLEGPWKEYEFKYKPGDPSQKPLWAAPHQPRLDWQLWFAALGSYQHNPWFVSLVHRLLRGHKEVLDLMGENPFPEHPPKYIRAVLYKYHYTHLNSSDETMWWRREVDSEYLPPQEGDSIALSRFLDYHALNPLGSNPRKDEYPNLIRFLEFVRANLFSVPTHTFLWTLAITILLVRIFNERCFGSNII